MKISFFCLLKSAYRHRNQYFAQVNSVSWMDYLTNGIGSVKKKILFPKLSLIWRSGGACVVRCSWELRWQ